ncbi:hypothetical protein B0H10DRAFT_651004 [Mycena sp. CBHHK59/15]|nr:hypothetical protein B0H10DRAFT_651004 [Mycena sp. CBHHK59/15]
MASGTIFPPEICAEICGRVVEPADLRALCLTSRSFRDEAERVLYRSVDLQWCSMRYLKSWCLAITRHAHLAKRVHALTLRLPNPLDASDAEKFSLALRRCVSLKDLAVFHEPDARPHNCVHGWIIQQCPFRLEKFTTSYFDPASIEQFWETQTEIRWLSISMPPAPRFELSDTQLVNLIAIDAPMDNVLALSGRRQLQRIQIHAQAMHNLQLSSLSQYSRTLTTLNLVVVHEETGFMRPHIFIKQVAVALPNLIHFGLVVTGKSEYHSPESFLILSLQHLARLQTVVLETHGGYQFTNQASITTATPARVKKFALSILEACPTLRQAVVAIEAQDASARQIACTLTRAPDGNIASEDGTTFDFETVSQFWKA